MARVRGAVTFALVTQPLRSRWVRRALVASCVAALGYLVALPALLHWRIQDSLDDAGYHQARFEVGHVGLDHVQLHDVELARGIDLGDVELDVGVSALFGARPSQATSRGGHLVVTEPLASSTISGAREVPLSRVRVSDLEVSRGARRVTVTGLISLPRQGSALAIDLAIAPDRSPETRLDLHVRGTDMRWEARGAGWTGRGHGKIDFARGTLRSTLDVTAPDATLEHARIRDGTLILAVEAEVTAHGLDIAATGTARAERLRVESGRQAMTASTVVAPIRLRATVGAVTDIFSDPIVIEAREAALQRDELAIAASHPVVTIPSDPTRPLRSPTQVRWRAGSGSASRVQLDGLTGTVDLASNVHEIGWQQLAVSKLALDRGTATLRVDGDRIAVSSARAGFAGGELSIAPFTYTGAATALTVRVNGVSANRLLPRRVRATGAIDGELRVALADAGVSLESGELHSRGGGRIQVIDRALTKDTGLAQRVTDTLGDFHYDTIGATLRAPGADPELRVVARGRGVAVAQELALDVNIRGVRDALAGFVARRSP